MEMDLNARWDRLQFGIRRSIRYHTRRCSFFDRLDKLTNAVGVMFGSIAIYAVVQAHSQALVATAGAIITCLSTANLVIGSVSRARDHSDFVRRFTELEQCMLAKQPSEDAYREVCNARLMIETEEPEPLRVLDMICHNELIVAEGRDINRLVRLSIWQRLFSSYFDVGHDKTMRAYAEVGTRS